eukprot:Clim_evm40s143 gene=Clim_evmTU40s143
MEKVTVTQAHSVAGRGDILNVHKGDVLMILDKTDETWWRASRMSDGMMGLVPANCVAKVESSPITNREAHFETTVVPATPVPMDQDPSELANSTPTKSSTRRTRTASIRSLGSSGGKDPGAKSIANEAIRPITPSGDLVTLIRKYTGVKDSHQCEETAKALFRYLALQANGNETAVNLRQAFESPALHANLIDFDRESGPAQCRHFLSDVGQLLKDMQDTTDQLAEMPKFEDRLRQMPAEYIEDNVDGPIFASLKQTGDIARALDVMCHLLAMPWTKEYSWDARFTIGLWIRRLLELEVAQSGREGNRTSLWKQQCNILPFMVYQIKEGVRILRGDLGDDDVSYVDPEVAWIVMTQIYLWLLCSQFRGSTISTPYFDNDTRSDISGDFVRSCIDGDLVESVRWIFGELDAKTGDYGAEENGLHSALYLLLILQIELADLSDVFHQRWNDVFDRCFMERLMRLFVRRTVPGWMYPIDTKPLPEQIFIHHVLVDDSHYDRFYMNDLRVLMGALTNLMDRVDDRLGDTDRMDFRLLALCVVRLKQAGDSLQERGMQCLHINMGGRDWFLKPHSERYNEDLHRGTEMCMKEGVPCPPAAHHPQLD